MLFCACSRFTESNSHLDNSLDVVTTKYSSSKSIMCTNQIISNATTMASAVVVAVVVIVVHCQLSQSVDEWIRQESEKTQKCFQIAKIDRCINGRSSSKLKFNKRNCVCETASAESITAYRARFHFIIIAIESARLFVLRIINHTALMRCVYIQRRA